MKTLYRLGMIGVLLLINTTLLVEAQELLVKYPPMTAEEMVEMAEEAAEYFRQKIAEGKTEEALIEFNQSPRFSMTEEGWKQLEKKVGDPALIEKLKFLKEGEFEETADLLSQLNKLVGKAKAPELRTIILKSAEEVFSPRWGKGSLLDYRFVITYNCDKNIHTSHPFLHGFVNKPAIDRLKDAKGYLYIYDLCNKVQQTNKGTWIEAWQPVPGKARSRPGRMVEYMTPVKGTPYQVGIISRSVTKSIEELNAM